MLNERFGRRLLQSQQTGVINLSTSVAASSGRGSTTTHIQPAMSSHLGGGATQQPQNIIGQHHVIRPPNTGGGVPVGQGRQMLGLNLIGPVSHSSGSVSQGGGVQVGLIGGASPAPPLSIADQANSGHLVCCPSDYLQ